MLDCDNFIMWLKYNGGRCMFYGVLIVYIISGRI